MVSKDGCGFVYPNPISTAEKENNMYGLITHLLTHFQLRNNISEDDLSIKTLNFSDTHMVRTKMKIAVFVVIYQGFLRFQKPVLSPTIW